MRRLILGLCFVIATAASSGAAQMRAGKVHAVIDRNGDHKADRVVLIAQGLDQPNGVAIRNGALYVATASKILRFDDIASSTSPGSRACISDSRSAIRVMCRTRNSARNALARPPSRPPRS